MLAIGGLKEKRSRRTRGGIKTVMIPDENVKDLVEFRTTKNKLEIIPVKWIDKAEIGAGAPAGALPRAAPGWRCCRGGKPGALRSSTNQDAA